MQVFMVSLCKYFSRLLLPCLIALFAIDALGDSSEASGALMSTIDKNGTICAGGWDSPRYDYWIKILGETLGETIGKSAAMQSIVAGSMVDTNGDLYNIIYTNVNSAGALYFIIKRAANNPKKCQSLFWYPWKFLYNKNVPKTPYYVLKNDSRYFQQCFYNAFQPCIAQEIENDGYLYVVVYAPITRLYTNTVSENKEGFVIGKFSKELSKKAEGYIHRATYRTHPRNKYGLETGNVQAWHDSGNLHLNYIYLENPNNTYTARWYQTYCPPFSSSSGFKAQGEDSDSRPGYQTQASGMGLQPRAIKYGGCVYQLGSCQAVPYIAKTQKDKADIVCWIDGTCDPFSLCSSADVRRCWDFCIVDNPYSPKEPIFCVLGLQCPNTGTQATLISKNNNLWKGAEKGAENPNLSWESNDIVLLLSSAPWDTNWWKYSQEIGFGPEDPQNVIYSTNVTFTTSSNVLGVGYKPEQLYYNTHKICTYTSGGGRKYIIYCYCYPGKERRLYLGYASYVVRKNSKGFYKVCLLTKTEKCISKTCNRIFHMDCRKGHLWITWIGGKDQKNNDDSTYYYYHIKADELIQE